MNEEKIPFTVQAAKASWIVPLLCIAMHMFLFSTETSSPESKKIFAIISFFMFFVGLILGIIGMTGVSKHGASRTVVPGLIGLLLNGLFFAGMSSVALVTYEGRLETEQTVVLAEEPLDYGTITDGIYTNKYFGLRVHIPEGWWRDTSIINFDEHFEDKPEEFKKLLKQEESGYFDIFKYYKHDINGEGYSSNSIFSFSIEKLKPAARKSTPKQISEEMKGHFKKYFGETISITSEPHLAPNRSDSLYEMGVTYDIGNDLYVISNVYIHVKKGYVLNFSAAYINEYDSTLDTLVNSISFEAL